MEIFQAPLLNPQEPLGGKRLFSAQLPLCSHPVLKASMLLELTIMSASYLALLPTFEVVLISSTPAIVEGLALLGVHIVEPALLQNEAESSVRRKAAHSWGRRPRGWDG